MGGCEIENKMTGLGTNTKGLLGMSVMEEVSTEDNCAVSCHADVNEAALNLNQQTNKHQSLFLSILSPPSGLNATSTT